MIFTIFRALNMSIEYDLEKTHLILFVKILSIYPLSARYYTNFKKPLKNNLLRWI
jgi:hypothetical protein